MSRWVVKSAGIIQQDFSGEVVIIDLETGNYFSLPGSAAVLWRRLEAGAASAADLADVLVSHHAVTADTASGDVEAFVADLVREGIVVEAGGDAPTAAAGPAPAAERTPYVAPKFETFRELQDLFLLDPVHDVDPAVGWPRAAVPDVPAASDTVRLSGADIVSSGVEGTIVVVNRDRGLWCRLDGDATLAWRSVEAGPVRLAGGLVRPLLEAGFVEPADPTAEPVPTMSGATGTVTIHEELRDQIRPWGERRRPPRTATTPVTEAICERLDAWFATAAPDATVSRRSVAGRRIDIEAPAGSDSAALAAALPATAADAAGDCSLRLRVWRGQPAEAAPLLANLVASLRANWAALCGPRGEVIDLQTESTTAIFDPGVGILSVVDRANGRGWAVKVDDRAYPFWEIGGPFRFLLHDIFSHHGFQMVHAAAVGDARGSVLVVGQGGAGKSSTAVAAAAGGLRYHGDDYCLVEPGSRTVHALYGTAKLAGDADVSRLPACRGRSINADSFESGGGGKGVFIVEDIFPGTLAPAAALRAIVVPRFATGAASRFRAGSRGDALAALVPSTVGQLPGAGPEDVARIERLVAGLTAFELDLGSDPRGVADVLGEVLAACSGSA